MSRASGKGARRHDHGRKGPAAVVAFPMWLWLAWELLAACWRFLAGQVVLRRPGTHDARYRTWAVPVSAEVELSRAEGIPRSRWARRPGYQRQLVRLGVLTTLVGWLVAPALTLAVEIIAGVVWAGSVAWRWHQAAYYQRVCGDWLEWAAERLGWAGEDNPRRWIQLPPYRIEAVPVAPVRAAVLRSGDPDGEGDGWLACRTPRLARWLEPLTTPVAETRWTRWLTFPSAGRPAWLAVPLRLVGRRLVAAVEASRALRVRPRVVAPDLNNPDAQIRIAYRPAYQAHDQDVAEVSRVITERTEGEEWQLRKEAKALVLALYHPSRLPRRVDWTSEIFAEYSLLQAPVGETTGGQVLTVNYKDQTPHVNASGRTGAGKTVTFRVLIANFLYHGGRSVLVDPKRIDFVKPFRGLDNVDLVTVEEQFPQVLDDMVREMERRYELIEQYTVRAHELGLPEMETNAELYFQPVMLCIDEKSRFTAKCKAWWKREGGGFDERGKPIAGKGDPITVEWERDLVARGRAAGMYMMSAAQQNAIPNTFPDTDIRGNYQYKILAGPADGPSWAVTFPGQRLKKLSSQVKGRAIVGVGSDLHETQLGCMEWQEIRRAAQHGEEIMAKENQKRAELLAQLTGKPVWEVSPLPWWVPSPASTPEFVPEQDTDKDTPKRPLALLPGASVHDDEEFAGQDEQNESHEAEKVRFTVSTDIHQNASNEGAEVRSAVRGNEQDRIRGNDAAAQFIGIRTDTFTRARRRAKKRGEGEVPGMKYDGFIVTYDPVQLKEWWNQRNPSGRKAS